MDMAAMRASIWQTVALIPPGKVATYGQVARLVGCPGHARFVGATLRQLPPGSTLPWHRVVNARGQLSLPEGSAAYQLQKSRLQAEGVVFRNKTLSLRRYAIE
ncbi:MAG: cysteine methyltransferase [Gammaproteobacteria bacterium]|nr:cysteine methyltransferase [Gammaproteobacteria bacterium]